MLMTNSEQTFAIDLGNTQTKLKSITGEYVGISQYLPLSAFGTALNVAATSYDICEFKLASHTDDTILWGPELDKLSLTKGLQNTRANTNRYSLPEYQTMFELALGYLVYKQSPQNDKSITIDLVIGLPSDDFVSGIYNQTVASFLKGEHVIQVFNNTYSITVNKINIVGQTQGTLFDLRFDNLGQDAFPDYMNKFATLVDFGGGTILFDQYEYGSRSNVSEQTFNGAHQFAADVAHQYNISKEGMSYDIQLSQNDILIMLKNHHDHEPYIINYNAYTDIDITDIVLKQKDIVTQGIINKLKELPNWGRSQYFIVTGGGAHLINSDLLNQYLQTKKLKATFLIDPEMANVRGFYKLGIALNPNMQSLIQRSIL